MLYATKHLPAIDFPEDPPGTEVYRQTPFTSVPRFDEAVGKTIESLFERGLRSEIVEIDSVIPAGTVLSTIPLAGTPLRQGSTVVVEVSTGIASVIPMVDLRGAPKETVSARIAEFAVDNSISLTWSLTEVLVASSALHGLVVTTTPAHGEPVEDGQNIVVKIGKNP
jgi:beta-lactam-binding protein with PASTA domain